MSDNDDLAASGDNNLTTLNTSHRTRSYPPGVLQRLQETELKLLQGFDAACREAGLTYFLAAGTCLGAVRHGGFIPWDDDIDVGMPVNDYLKFQQIAPQILPAGISMHTVANTKGAPFLWTKLFLDGTRFLEEDSLQAGIEQGIFLDIFPYIGVSDNDAEAKREFTRYRSLQISSYVHHLAHPTGAGKDLKGHLLGAAFSVAHHSLGRLIKPKQLYKRFNAMLGQEKQGNHLINISGKQFIAYPKSCIYPVQEINFAGIPCFAPHDTDTYLRLKYGDYMQLPSPENRHTHTPVLLDFGDGVNAMQKTCEPLLGRSDDLSV